MPLNQSNDLGDYQKSDEGVEDVRSPVAIGYAWASIIISMGFELVIPVVLGVYADYKLGTKCVFLLIGIVLGFLVVTVNFFKLLKSKKLQQIGKTTGSTKRDNQDH